MTPKFDFDKLCLKNAIKVHTHFLRPPTGTKRAKGVYFWVQDRVELSGHLQNSGSKEHNYTDGCIGPIEMWG